MLLKLGDKNVEVTEVQKLLSMLGYDLIIDGEYNSKTVRSINSFQKKNRLTIDGEVGKKTLQALKAAQKNTAKEIKGLSTPIDYAKEIKVIVSKQLASSQYIKQNFKKSQIFVHFTLGGQHSENVINNWDSGEPQVSSAYVIDGETAHIHETYNPNFWSYHLGIKGTNGKLDKISIGIEMCSWGPLTEKDGKFFTYTNKEIEVDKVYTLDEPFRGFLHYYAYSEEQLNSLEKLMCWLIEKYEISVQNFFDKNWFEYNEDIIKKITPGIYSHSSVRHDKYDSYPDKRLIELLNRISKKYN